MKIIRSTKLSLLPSNAHKLRVLDAVLTEYGRVVNIFIDYLWKLPELPTKMGLVKAIINLPATWLAYDIRLCAAREALGMIVAARESAKATGATKVSKPVHRATSMQMSANTATLKERKVAQSFDCWLHMMSIGHHPTYGRIILDLPIHLHKHYHKLAAIGGKRNNSYIITRKYVQVSF